MDKKLLVGVELLDYIKKLNDIADMLVNAEIMAREITDILNISKDGSEDSAYVGKAKETMQTFAINLKENMYRLALFYKIATQYVDITYETMYQSDEAIAAWLMSQEK